MTTEPVFQPPATPVPVPAEVPAQDQDHDSAGDAAASNDIDDFNPDDFEYVRIDGVVRAIPKASVQEQPETATQPALKAAMVEVIDPHFYVWLADGKVIRVKQSDLPAPAGSNAQYGHWQIDNKVFLIVNVVPVEDIVKIVKGEAK